LSGPAPWVAILGLTLLGAAPHQAGAPAEDGFEAMMTEANARMHAGMMNARFTGDPDRDFARMMIPHHQGAIDMALAELRYGKDKRLRRLARAASAGILRRSACSPASGRQRPASPAKYFSPVTCVTKLLTGFLEQSRLTWLDREMGAK